MIRRGVMAVSVAAAAATLALALVSEWRPIHWGASRAPELSLEPIPTKLLFAQMPNADQWWAHTVITKRRVTVSYSGEYEPPFRALRRGKQKKGVIFSPTFAVSRYNLMARWVSRASKQFDALPRTFRVDGQYREELEVTEREGALKLEQVLGDSAFLLRHTNTPHRQVVLRFPLWVPFCLFSGPPAIAFIRGPLRRWRRRRKGYCVKCGYDLTGNVSGVCPECGEAV